MALPIMASVLAFVTYSLTGHSLDPAIIFSSLTLFQLLRMPVMFLRQCHPLIYLSTKLIMRFSYRVQCYRRCFKRSQPSD